MQISGGAEVLLTALLSAGTVGIQETSLVQGDLGDGKLLTVVVDRPN